MNYNHIDLYSTQPVCEAIWILLADTQYVRDPWKGPVERGREFECELLVASCATQTFIEEIIAVLRNARESGVIEMILEAEACQWSYAVQISRDGVAKELPTEPTFDSDDMRSAALNQGGFWSALKRQNQWAGRELGLILGLEKNLRLEPVNFVDFEAENVTKH